MEAIHRLELLLLLLTLLLSTTATASSCSAATAFVKSTCNSTTYPDLCNEICLPYATKIKCDLQRMSNYLLKAALSSAKNSSKTVSKISKDKGLDSSEKAAVKDCIELVKDSIAQIKQSIKELASLKNATSDGDKKFKLSNIKTWMSAALTDYQTCIDGLDEEDANSDVKTNIMDTIQYGSKHSSNSLSIINKIQ